MILFDHQAEAFRELLARAQTFFAGHWQRLPVKTRWHSLIVGPTATGKTALVSALSQATRAEAISVSLPCWTPLGCQERGATQTLRVILGHIQSNKRTILFFDEADKIYHEASWNSYVRGELYSILDGRWPAGLKSDDDDEDEKFPALNERQTGEKLRNTVFIVAAGTFQEFYDEQTMKPRVIGFHASSQSQAAVSGPTTDIIVRKLPRELSTRFNSEIIFLPELSREHYFTLIKQTEKVLPSWIAPAFREAAGKRLEQAIAAKSGCRFIEDALMDAIKTARFVESKHPSQQQ